jgi:hypothetical protein
VSEEAAEPIAMTAGAPWRLTRSTVGQYRDWRAFGPAFAIPAADNQLRPGTDVIAAGYISPA